MFLITLRCPFVVSAISVSSSFPSVTHGPVNLTARSGDNLTSFDFGSFSPRAQHHRFICGNVIIRADTETHEIVIYVVE
mgnify:CR=1 FL=1